MAKRNTTGISLGSDYDIDKTVVTESGDEKRMPTVEPKKEEEPYNCLRKERIIVRHVDKQTGIVTDKNHVLYGGMADGSKRSFVVPMTESGYVPFLTPEEQKCLENAMGLEEGTLSINKPRAQNFWSETQDNGINRVYLYKQDNHLDLSIPADYIKYKILLANDAVIAPSQTVLEQRPKVTYQFVMISEGVEATNAASKLNTNYKAWMELGKIQDDVDKLRTVLSILERKQVAPTTKIGYLQNRIVDYVNTKPKDFLKIVEDKYFATRVTIQKAVDRGIVIKRGNYYYDKETNTPLCESNEDPTIVNACKYLNSVKNDSLKFSIEQKISQS